VVVSGKRVLTAAPPAEAHVTSMRAAQMAWSAATNGEASLPVGSGRRRNL